LQAFVLAALRGADALGWFGVLCIGLLSIAPLAPKSDANSWEVTAALARRLALIGVFAKLVASGVFWVFLSHPDLQSGWLAREKAEALSMTFAFMGALTLRILGLRYLAPALSSWLRSRRIAQEVEGKTDIRDEMTKYKPIVFDPEQLFVDNMMTLGKDKNGDALRIPIRAFKSTHVQIIGATGRGKGVLLQTIYSQVVRMGFGAWYFDPKGDEFIPVILAYEAARAGVPFYVLDLVHKKGAYAPFSGGTIEERTERMNTAFMLERGGAESDYYKNTERVLLRRTVQSVGSQQADLKTLEATFADHKLRHFGKGNKNLENPMTVEAMLQEWQSLATVAVSPKAGLDVGKAIRDRAVVYVRCALRGLTADVASVLLIELTDELIKAPPSARGEHIVLGLDEAATLMSAQVVTSLTAVRSTGTTMMLAYQASGQVRNMRDQRVDKDAAEGTVNINCETRLIYGTTIEETAEQISLSSGNKRVLTVMGEGAEVGGWGGERWSGKRSFREEDAALITTDTIKALPERVAVLLRPNATAEIVWTCWMPKRTPDAYNAAVKQWEASLTLPSLKPEQKTIQLQVPPRPAPKKAIPKEESPE